MEFNIPEELRESKETWFKIFTNQSLIATLVFASVGWVIRWILSACGAPIVGTVILFLFALAGYLLFTIRLPGTSVLRGGRLYLSQKLWRWFLHRKQRGVYLPVYQEEEDDGAEEIVAVADDEEEIPILT